MGFFLPLAVAAGSAVAGLAGLKAAGKDSGAGATLDAAARGIEGVRGPRAEDLTYELERLVQQGVISPEEARAYTVDRSAMEGIDVDPRLKAAQMGALSNLQEIGAEKGLTAIDRAKLEEIMSRTGGQERGAREAIEQRMAEQGKAGSGFEFAAKMGSHQDAATRASQEGLDVAAAAQQRALDAIQQAGSLGGQMRGQEFGEKSEVAQAQDALAKFNAEHLQSTNLTNVGARNAAQATNLGERQRVADTNAGITGENRRIAAEAKQTVFENELDKRKAIATALAAKAQEQSERQKAKAAAAGGLLGAGATIGAGLLAKSDERSKDVGGKPDLDAFMASLKPAEFRYKDPSAAGAAPGENVGVMAQDVEKTPVGKTMVKNTAGGKMLDMQKGFGVILAALASLHDKYEELEAKGAA